MNDRLPVVGVVKRGSDGAGARKMLRCEKQIRIGYRKGRRGNVSVTREHYLRDDISCKVRGCALCEDISSNRNECEYAQSEVAWAHAIETLF